MRGFWGTSFCHHFQACQNLTYYNGIRAFCHHFQAWQNLTYDSSYGEVLGHMGIEEALAILEGSHSRRLRDCTSHTPVMASTNSQSFQQKMENDYNVRRKAYQRDRAMRATVVEKTFWS